MLALITVVTLVLPAMAGAGTSLRPDKRGIATRIAARVPVEARGTLVQSAYASATCRLVDGVRPEYPSPRGAWCAAGARIDGTYTCRGRLYIQDRAFVPEPTIHGWACAPSIVLHLWPVEPIDQPHAIRGSFLDLRTGYHTGIDIPVDDSAPAEGAPPWASQRVHAVQEGVVSYAEPADGGDGDVDAAPTSCAASHFTVGAFSYWHAVPTVPSGTLVQPRDAVGWTCMGSGHLHVNERRPGLGLVNPIRPWGVIGPFPDGTPPSVSELGFFTPCDGVLEPWSPGPGVAARQGIPPCGDPVDAATVRGIVDLRFSARDEFPATSELLIARPYLYEPLHPWAAFVSVIRAETGEVVLARMAWRADRLATQLSPTEHFAPGHLRWAGFSECSIAMDLARCEGRWRFRAFSTPVGRYWDSTSVADGQYVVRVEVRDRDGAAAIAELPFVVTNAPPP